MAAGLSEHLGVSLTLVRVAFVLLTVLGAFSGAVIYGVMWVMLPSDASQEPAGLEAGARAGMRPDRVESDPDRGVMVSLAAVGIGFAWIMFSPAGQMGELFWPFALGAVGVVMVWLQADQGGRSDPEEPARGKWLGIPGRRASLLRLGGGLLLFGLGASWILAARIGLSELPVVLAAALALIGSILLVAAPWIYRFRHRVRMADEQRMRAEAKADMAAHLHDSVLQTLALIQRRAGESEAVASLARRQERELRAWLYGESVRPGSLRTALDEVSQDVEASFGTVSVEVVCVGDVDVDESIEALVLAVGETVTNAAKHSGAARIDVFADAEDELVEVFVRDRGAGFDPDSIPADRMGVRESILARMQRHGGRAWIHSAVGEGTEVRLEMER